MVGIDGVLAGAVVSAMLGLIKIIDYLVRSRGKRNGEPMGAFTPSDRGTANASNVILSRTNAEGDLLVYGVGHLQKTLEAQTGILGQIQTLLSEQTRLMSLRIGVCESHTSILNRMAERTKR